MITRDTVDSLSRLSSDEWPIVSFFLRIDKERIDEDYTIRLKNLLREAADGLDDRFSHDQRKAVEDDLERIKEFLRDHGAEYGRGIAIVASTPAGIWEVHDVPSTIDSCIHIGFSTLVEPLIRVLEQMEPFCTCLVSRDQSRIFYGHLGQFDELFATRDDTVPGQHEQGGWAQARYERHIDEHVRGHFKRIADELFRLAQERPYRFLVLSGPDEVTSAFVDMLHPYVKDRHVGTIRLLLEANINEIHQESCNVIERWLRGEKERALGILRDEVLSGDLGAAGLDNTISALQQGQVLTLLVNETFSAPGAVCQRCHAVQPPDATERDECVYCGGPLRRLDDIVPEIVTSTFQQGAKVIYLDSPELQQAADDLGHIGAILRFAVPTESLP